METEYNFLQIKYKIIKKNKKHIGIKITNEGMVIVTVPFEISDEIINNVIRTKEKWILDKLRLLNERKDKSNKKLFESGEYFLYLGRKVQLYICYDNEDKTSVKMQDGKLNVFINSIIGKEEKIIRELIINFYKEEAKKILKHRTYFYSKLMNISPKNIIVKAQKTIWGSCSSKGNINYNYRIIMASIEIVDYVVVHELCHLIHMNHSKEYWNTVRSIMPDYEIRKLWLKNNEYMLDF
jgi:predicted metal-dependent hydrolase